MLLPVPLPDELFVSVLARLGRLNGVNDLREVAEHLLGLKQCPSFIDAKLNLPDFCLRLGNAYGDPENLLERLTAFSARRSLGEIEDQAWKSLVLGEECISLGELTFFGVVELRFCPSCRESDIERGGVAYWHRTHQLPILHRCVIHGDRLKRAVVKRAALHQSFPLPGDFPDDRALELPVVWNDHFEIELAVFSDALLMQARPRQGLVGQALLEGLWERKFLNSKGLLRASELFESLIPRIFHDVRLELSKECLGIIRQIVNSIREPTKGMAFGRALLLCALFGHWRIVAERCKWVEALGRSVQDRIHDPRGQEQDATNVKERYREKCLAYITSNPAHSRLGFTKQNYRSFRWLLHNDRSWLDNCLPVALPDMDQLTLI
ncbi:MAG: TniQ family protein [Nitrosomonas ureae]